MVSVSYTLGFGHLASGDPQGQTKAISVKVGSDYSLMSWLILDERFFSDAGPGLSLLMHSLMLIDQNAFAFPDAGPGLVKCFFLKPFD